MNNIEYFLFYRLLQTIEMENNRKVNLAFHIMIIFMFMISLYSVTIFSIHILFQLIDLFDLFELLIIFDFIYLLMVFIDSTNSFESTSLFILTIFHFIIITILLLTYCIIKCYCNVDYYFKYIFTSYSKVVRYGYLFKQSVNCLVISTHIIFNNILIYYYYYYYYHFLLLC